jgi:hypothetical protein
MVSATYLVDKPAGPSKLARFFHQRVLPPVIDATAQVEAILERAAQGGRRRPFTALGIAFGIGFLVSALRPRL